MPDDVAVVITVPPEPPAAALLAAGALDAAPVAGALLLLLLLPPLAHAATSTAVATPTPSWAADLATPPGRVTTLDLASTLDLARTVPPLARTGSCMLNLLPIIIIVSFCRSRS